MHDKFVLFSPLTWRSLASGKSNACPSFRIEYMLGTMRSLLATTTSVENNADASFW